jgi:hypothetical protein
VNQPVYDMSRVRHVEAEITLVDTVMGTAIVLGVNTTSRVPVIMWKRGEYV